MPFFSEPLFLSYGGTFLFLIFGTTLNTYRTEEWIKASSPLLNFRWRSLVDPSVKHTSGQTTGIMALKFRILFLWAASWCTHVEGVTYLWNRQITLICLLSVYYGPGTTSSAADGGANKTLPGQIPTFSTAILGDFYKEEQKTKFCFLEGMRFWRKYFIPNRIWFFSRALRRIPKLERIFVTMLTCSVTWSFMPA